MGRGALNGPAAGVAGRLPRGPAGPMARPELRWKGPHLAGPPSGYVRRARIDLSQSAERGTPSGTPVAAARGPGPETGDDHRTSPAPAEMTNGAVAVLAGIALLVSSTGSMLVPALPMIQAQFGITGSLASWVPAIYLLTGALSVPIFCKFGALYGRKRVLVLVGLLYSAALLLNGLAGSFTGLLLACAVGGIGFAMLPLGLLLIRDELPPSRVPSATGLQMGMTAAGVVIGLSGGAAIMGSLGGATGLPLFAPIAIALTLLAGAILQESTAQRTGRIELPVAAVLSIGIAALLVGIAQAAVAGWTAAGTLALFAVGLIFFALSGLGARRAPDPFADLRARAGPHGPERRGE